MNHPPPEILKSFCFSTKHAPDPEESAYSRNHFFNLYSYPFPGGKDDKTFIWIQIILFQEEQKVVSSYLFSAKIILRRVHLLSQYPKKVPNAPLPLHSNEYEYEVIYFIFYAYNAITAMPQCQEIKS